MASAHQRFRVVTVVIAAIAAIVGVGLAPRPVQAHTDVEYTLPAADEVVDVPVASITVAFADPVTIVGAGFEVFTPDERIVQPPYETEDDRVFVLLLDPPLAGGAVGVRYEVVAEDGHVITGSWSFTVTAAPVTAAPTTPLTTAPPTDAPATAAPQTSGPATTAPAGTSTAVSTIPDTAPSTPTTEPVTAPDGDGDGDGGGPGAGLLIGIAVAVALGAAALFVVRSRTSSSASEERAP